MIAATERQFVDRHQIAAVSAMPPAKTEKSKKFWERGGSSPPFGIVPAGHKPNISDTQAPQKSTLVGSSISPSEHQPHTSEHENDTSLHEKCVICVSQIPDDLAMVIRAWDNLPAPLKARIVAMVTAAGQQ